MALFGKQTETKAKAELRTVDHFAKREEIDISLIFAVFAGLFNFCVPPRQKLTESRGSQKSLRHHRYRYEYFTAV